MIDLTVAICTYNGENRLPQVLERLRAQVYTERICWEIVVVDNNSTDNTAKVVQNYQAILSQVCPLIYCFEPQQGLAFARQRAVSQDRGRLIAFLDDDNLPAFDWVAAAYSFGQKHPQAGAYGSQIHGDFEVNPPENFKKIAAFLAIIERGSKAFIYEPRKKLLPPAAGLVVRKQVWCDNVPKQLFLKGRIGKSMLASEDIEAIAHIQNAGWQIWYNPEMHIYHKIPHHRLERNYLISLVRGIGLARHHIRMIRIKSWQRFLLVPIYFINDLRKVIVSFLKYRKVIKTDVTAACETEFLRSSLISPFYLSIKSTLELNQNFFSSFSNELSKFFLSKSIYFSTTKKLTEL